MEYEICTTFAAKAKALHVKRLLSNTVKYLLIVVFAYYYVGNTAFVHTHVVDHFLVTHSHPYLPGTHHSHTEAEWETVSWFNLLCLDSSHELPVVPFILFFLGFIFLPNGTNRIVRSFRLFHLRSPPCHVF